MCLYLITKGWSRLDAPGHRPPSVDPLYVVICAVCRQSQYFAPTKSSFELMESGGQTFFYKDFFDIQSF